MTHHHKNIPIHTVENKKLDDDAVKISVVLREAPTKLRDNVNSQQFKSDYNKLRAIIQAYLNSNKRWISNDFRNDTKESDPLEVDYIGNGNGNGKGKGNGNGKGKGKGKEANSDMQDKECYVCGKRGHFARDCWPRANQDRTVNEVEGAKVESDAAKEFVFTIENSVKYISLTQSGCEVSEDGLVWLSRVVW